MDMRYSEREMSQVIEKENVANAVRTFSATHRL